MRIPALLLCAAAPVFAADSVTALGYTWSVPSQAEWSASGQLLKMLKPYPDKKPVPRRPSQFAVAQTPAFEEVTMDVEVKRGPERESLILVYAWKDEAHFNYAHLSPDMPLKQPVHSGMFHVYGGERVRISSTEGPATLPGEEWTPVRLVYSAKTHLCEVTVKGEKIPSLRAIDFSLGAGRVGLGSFFNTAGFRNLRIQGR